MNTINVKEFFKNNGFTIEKAIGGYYYCKHGDNVVWMDSACEDAYELESAMVIAYDMAKEYLDNLPEIKYCVSYIDNSMFNAHEKMVIDIFGDRIEASDDFEYTLTKEQAENAKAKFEQIAKDNGWDWAMFFIEDNEYLYD